MSGSEVFLSKSIGKLAFVIRENYYQRREEGNPVEWVIGGSFLEKTFLGEKLVDLPFISRALANFETNGEYDRELFEKVQYGSMDQELYMGTREEISKQIFGSYRSYIFKKSDLVLMEGIRNHPFSNPTVVLLIPSNMMGPSIVVMVLPGTSQHQKQPYVEFRVGIKTTGLDQVSQEEIERNAITTLLEGVYTTKDGTPRMNTNEVKDEFEDQKDQKGKKMEKTLWPAVIEHDTLYNLNHRTIDSRTSADSVPTAGNLDIFVRMRIELSKTSRNGGTKPELHDNGRVLDILLDKDNIDNVVINPAAKDVLLSCINSEDISFIT